MIKNVLTIVAIFAIMSAANAQGITYRLNNYTLQNGINSTDNLIQGAEVGYLQHLGKIFDLYVPLRIGARGELETTTNSVTTKTTKIGTLGLDAALQAKYDNGHNFIVPFLSAGIGTENYAEGWKFGAPIGGGLNLRLSPAAFLTLATNYRLGLTNTSPGGWAHSLGLTVDLNGAKDIETPTVTTMKPDTQAQLDAAAAKVKAEAEARAKAEAEAAAKAQMEAEARAKAEAEAAAKAKMEAEARAKAAADAAAAKAKADAAAAAAKAEADARAKAQTTTTTTQPVVVSEEVKKVLEYALKGVQFETGSAQLTKASYSILDEVASTMKANPSLRVSIEGHTDKTGNEAANVKLSAARAKSCMTYLISKGIGGERLKESGYGSARPIADNATPEGRRQNRRVEFVPF